MLATYIRMYGGVWHVVNKYNYSKSGRGVLPDKSCLHCIKKIGRKFYMPDLKHCLNNTLNQILVIMQAMDQMFLTELH